MMLLALVWAEPRPVDDLFIALAGGRDVLAGRLGAPDDWSYTTEGRVWLNQNWGSHVLFYATHAAAGPTGLLALKAALLLAGTTFLAAAARAHGAAWPEAMLVAATAFAAGRSYVELRPSLVGLVLTAALLATLARALTRPAWLAVAVPVVAVWANAHGSFLFGLGLLGAWTIAAVTVDARRAALGLAATAAAVGLATFANPFGPANLTHALVVGQSVPWRTVAEWVPLYVSDPGAFGSRWEICVAAALFLGLVLARFVAGRGGDGAADGVARTRRALAVFDTIVIIAVAVMAVRARRFVPLALLVLTPPFAAQITWWQRRLGTAWPTRGLAAALAVAVAVAAPPLLRRYAPDNPVFQGLSVFENMIDAPVIPRDALAFLRANDLHGNIYAAWEQEGFIHWSDPTLKVLIGGRAQQIYDEPILQLHEDIRADKVPVRTALAPYQVGIALLPMTAPYANPLGRLIYSEDSPWVYLYCDGRQVILVDTSKPELAATMAAFEAKTLRYPSPAIEATSRMMYATSPHAPGELDDVRSLARAAAAAAPTALAYVVLGDAAISERTSQKATRDFLASERERLASLAATEGESLKLAQARLSVARMEATLIVRTVDPEGVQRAKDALALRVDAVRTMLTKWAYGWDPDVF
jgi:hypothetical protein